MPETSSSALAPASSKLNVAVELLEALLAGQLWLGRPDEAGDEVVQLSAVPLGHGPSLPVSAARSRRCGLLVEWRQDARGQLRWAAAVDQIEQGVQVVAGVSARRAASCWLKPAPRRRCARQVTGGSGSSWKAGCRLGGYMASLRAADGISYLRLGVAVHAHADRRPFLPPLVEELAGVAAARARSARRRGRSRSAWTLSGHGGGRTIS